MLKTINYEWIQKYFELTDLDIKALGNPQHYIIDKGGFVYFAEYNNQIVAAVALEKISDRSYALTKMGVSAQFHGLKIGQLLMNTAIDKGRELNLDNLILYTSHKLIHALNLYYKNNFKSVPLDYTPYERATIKMQFDY